MQTNIQMCYHNKQTINKTCTLNFKKKKPNSKYKHKTFKEKNKELRNKIMKQKTLICKMTS